MKRPVNTFLMLIFVFACSSDSPTKPVQDIALRQVFTNLSFTRPVFLTHSNDTSNRLFVVEQDGIISFFANDSNASQKTTFIDLRDRVNASSSEMGLLGLAFHPDFASNGFFFVNYTTTANGPRRSVVSRFSASGNSGDPNSELILFEVNQPFANHNGGMVAFGTDGMLYISFGDGGSGGDPEDNGQDPRTLLGTILRIDIDSQAGGLNYAIPPDNPFASDTTDARKEIFAYGLRNPWRFSIDAPTGQLWCGDVGQGQWEEIDLITNGGNYGWNIMEGRDCYNSSNCNQDNLELPITVYDHGGPKCSVTGGYVYRGPAIPALQGAYIYGDYCSGEIWMLRYDGGQVTEESLLLSSDISISSFGVDADNELYILDLGGSIYRLAQDPTTDVSEIGQHPTRFALEQNYPNPFNPETEIRFTLLRAELVEVSIFNVLGRKIKTLLRGVIPEGDHSVAWDGKNDAGKAVPSGTYIYQLASENEKLSRRMTLLK